VRRILEDVKEGRKQGFIAVGAMIEGFDFPSLKIAAYHRPHRSLAPTLQFLGRLSRATPSGVRGELLAIPEEVEGETQELYRRDRDWAELMPEIVDAAQTREREIRRYVASAHLSGPLELAPRALTPPRSARIYRMRADALPNLDVDPERIGRARVVFRFHDPDTSMLALVTHRVVEPRWAQTPALEAAEFMLHLATWIEPQGVLFVTTESAPALDDLLEAFGVLHEVRNLSPEDLVRLVSAADPGSYFSVGLRAGFGRRARGASYDMTAGRAVERTLDYMDRNSSTLGHLMARPRSGNRGTLGFSVAKSKLWEPENAQSLLDYRRWAVERAAELDRPGPADVLPGLDVQLGQPFADIPAEPLGAALAGEFITGELVFVLAGEPLRAATIDIEVTQHEDSLRIAVILDGAQVWVGDQGPSGNVVPLDDGNLEVLESESGEVISVSRALRDAPVAIFLRDGGMILGDVLMPARREVGPVPTDSLMSDPWQDIDIQQELGAVGSVQARTKQIAEFDAGWVVTDHGSGELADFIALRATGETATLRFYHCKGAGGAAPGRRVGDLYEVIGQSVKGISRLVDPEHLWVELSRRLEQRAAFQVLTGDADRLAEFLAELAARKAEPPTIEIIAVQPGVSMSDLTDWPAGRALVHAAIGWCSGEHMAFRLLGSE
jgi:hypothetical protein